jgi:membrane dipeptidase
MLEWNVREEAERLHQSILVCDMTLPWVSMARRNILRQNLKFQCLERFVESGANYVSLCLADDHGIERTIRILGTERAFIRKNEHRYSLVETPDDIVRAKEEGKLAVSFHFQGSLPVDRELGLVEVYYRLGVRQMLLAYNLKNFVGDGCHERTDAGLSNFGVSLIKEMNRVGMILDCSHCGYRTSMEAIEVSSAPTIFSHSNARSIHDHPRNIYDDQIKASAAGGGIIGINGLGIFLGSNSSSAKDLVRHIDYIAGLVGPQYVGLGLDYCYDMETMLHWVRSEMEMFPRSIGYDVRTIQQFPPENLPRLTELLLDHGYTEKEVRGIMGENFLRVAKEIWK